MLVDEQGPLESPHSEAVEYRTLPLFIRSENVACLIVGGGQVALRKTQALLAAGAAVTVIAPRLHPRLARYHEAKRIIYLAGEFVEASLDAYALIICAADKATNKYAAACARHRGKWVNVVDEPEQGNVLFPALVRRGPVTIGISSNGTAPVLARMIRAQIDALLPEKYTALATLAGRWRTRVAAKIPDLRSRRRFWESIFHPSALVRRTLEQGVYAADNAIETTLKEWQTTPPATAGRVILVGAGPGAPGMLTLAAVRALQVADVVLYDRLVHRDVLTFARRDAMLEYVGKNYGDGHRGSQEQINARLIELAAANLQVVRLKGGDPMIFGRGGEEINALRAAGIDFRVIPGVTAALAAAASTEIPLTHRRIAQTVTFVTASSETASDALDWQALARLQGTVVFYMGVRRIPLISERLQYFGCSGHTPVAIVEHATTTNERIFRTSLAELPQVAAAEGVSTPALIICGDVASLYDDAEPSTLMTMPAKVA